MKVFFISLSIQVKIKVKLSRTNENKEIKIKEGSRIQDLLKKLKFKPDKIIVLCNNKPIPIDYTISSDKELILVEISSGG